MAGINFKDGPGGRMKRAQQAQVLRVSSPNDPRLKAFQDSTNVHDLQKYEIGKWNKLVKMTPAQRNTFYEKEHIANATDPKQLRYNQRTSTYNLDIPDKNLNMIGTNQYIDSPGIRHFRPLPFPAPQQTVIYEKPERKVISTPRPTQPVIKQMGGRQADFPEIVAPAVRPMPMPVPVQQLPPMIEEAPVVPQEAAPIVAQKPKGVAATKHISPIRGGGWSNQPLLMRMFPKLYAR